MSTFSFSAVIGTAVIAELRPLQSTSLEQAKQEGRFILAQLAMEHVPMEEDMISVELFNGSGKPVAELRLCYQVIEKQPAAIAKVD